MADLMEFLDEVKMNLTDGQYMKGIEIAKKQNETESGFYKVVYMVAKFKTDPDDPDQSYLDYTKTISILKLSNMKATRIKNDNLINTCDFQYEEQRWLDETTIGDEIISNEWAVVISIEKVSG